MALRKWTKNGIRTLSDREIKAEIMNRLGLNPHSVADNKTYKRLYDVQRLRTVNYNRQQMLETPIRANENWLRTLRRQQSGEQLTAHQAGILSTSSQNTAAYARRIERGDQSITDQGILNLERQYHGLLTQNTLGLEKQYEEFRTEKVVVTQNLVDKHGEIIAIYTLSEGEAPPEQLPKGARLEPPFTERIIRKDQSIQDVKGFLESLADQLHAYQDARLGSNRGLYGKGSLNKLRKKIGS